MQQPHQQDPQPLEEDEEDDLFEGITKEEIKELVDEGENLGEVELTDSSLVGLLKSLNALLQQNAELRAEFPKEPCRFLASEEDLFEKLKTLEQIAAMPELLHTFVGVKGYEALLLLLGHQNADIVNESLHILVELTDPEGEAVVSEGKGLELIQLLIENGVQEALNDVVARWTVQPSVFFNALHLVENICDVKAERVRHIYEKHQSLVKALTEQIALPNLAVDQLRLYCSQILALLLQESQNAIDFSKTESNLTDLLSTLNIFRKDKLEEEEKIEFVQNLADVLGACLISSIKTQEDFSKMEGIELMVACLRGVRPLRKVAIKLLHFALNDQPRNTERLLEADGIKYAFGFLMRESKLTADGQFAHYHDDLSTDHEHILFITACLLTHTKGVKQDRVIYKFKENEYQKIHRLCGMLSVYMAQSKEDPQEEKEGQQGQHVYLLVYILSILITQTNSKSVAKFTLKIIKSYSLHLRSLMFWLSKYSDQFDSNTGSELDGVQDTENIDMGRHVKQILGKVEALLQ